MISDFEIVSQDQPIFILYVNNLICILNPTEKVIQFADDTCIFSCKNKSSFNGKIKEKLKKTEEYVEMNNLSLNSNETELISNIFLAVFLILNQIVRKTKCSKQNLLDSLVLKTNETLILTISWIKP